jgi:hypothetical protein
VSALSNLKVARLALAVLAVAALAGLAACGSDEKKTSGKEGEFVDVGPTLYQVQLTRLLNPQQRPDEDYLRGQAAIGGKEAFLAVFLKIENKGDKPYQPPRSMYVIDTQGNKYLPVDTTQAGGFGLEFGTPIEAGQAAPAPDSPAALGPNAAALLLFRVKEESVTDNLPLELKIPVEGQDPATIELDI